MFVAGVNGNPIAPLCSGRDAPPAASEYATDGDAIYNKRVYITQIAANGDWLAFHEIHETGANDNQCSGLGLYRSKNQGLTWQPCELVYRRSDFANNSKWVNGLVAFPPLPANATFPNRLIVLFTKSDGATPNQVMNPWETHSDDNGLTWSSPVDLTSSLKKTSGTTAPFGGTNGPWGWFMFGPSQGVIIQNGVNAGMLVAACDHRYSTDQSLTSWVHFSLSNDWGATWSIGGGFDETNGTNDHSNECSIIEIGSSGSIFLNCRIANDVAADGRSNKRGQATVTAAQMLAGGTFPAMAFTSDGTLSLVSHSTNGSLAKLGTDIYLAIANSAASRARTTVYKSTDNGATFPTHRMIFGGYGGYPSLLAIDASTLWLVCEANLNNTDANGDGMTAQQVGLSYKFDTTWFNDPSTYPDIFDFQLNDGPIGELTTAIGAAPIHEWSGQMPQGRGGTAYTWDADGIVSSGTGTGVILTEGISSAPGHGLDPGFENVTYLLEFKLAAGTWPTAIGLFSGSVSGSRVRVTGANATKKLIITFNDGSLSLSKTTSATYNDAAWHRMAIVYQRGTGLSVYFASPGGSFAKDGSTVSDTLNAANPVGGSASPFRLGSDADGTIPCPSGSYFRRFKVVRKALALADLATYMPENETKIAPLTKAGYNPPTNPKLPTFGSETKLALFLPWKAPYGGSDRWGAEAWSAMPPINGTGISSYIDPVNRKLFKHPSASRGSYWDRNADLGLHVRPAYFASAYGAFQAGAADATYDFVQTTGTFTIIVPAICFLSNPGNQMLLDSANGTSANNGFYVMRQTGNGKLNLMIGRGSAGNPRIDVDFNLVLTVGTNYGFAIVGNGGNAAPDLYYWTPSGLRPASITKITAGSSLDNTAGGAATNALTVFSSVGGSSGCNVRCGPILLLNTALANITAVQPYADSICYSRIIPAVHARLRQAA
jgi:sialidase-1